MATPSLLPLESERWAQLKHAFGAAHDIPQLLVAIEEEPVPQSSGHPAEAQRQLRPWEDVYAKLSHQGSIYSATYAAIPHIVSIAENGSLEQRIETMILAGTILVEGLVESKIPGDLIADFSLALRRVRRWSLMTIREAGPIYPDRMPVTGRWHGVVRRG